MLIAAASPFYLKLRLIRCRLKHDRDDSDVTIERSRLVTLRL